MSILQVGMSHCRYTIFRARCVRADEAGESVSCPTERMRGSESCEGLIRIKVRRLCRPARPRPHLALVTFPPW